MVYKTCNNYSYLDFGNVGVILLLVSLSTKLIKTIVRLGKLIYNHLQYRSIFKHTMTQEDETKHVH